MAQLVSLTHREAYFSQKDKNTCRETILSWWHWLPGTWPAYGVSRRSCWLSSGWLGMVWQGLTGCSYAATSGLSDNLAGCSGAKSRTAICSLPQPSCPQQPYFFSLQSGAPSLYLCECVHASPCGNGIWKTPAFAPSGSCICTPSHDSVNPGKISTKEWLPLFHSV